MLWLTSSVNDTDRVSGLRIGVVHVASAMATVAGAIVLAFLVSQSIGPLFPERTTERWGVEDLYSSRGASARVGGRLAITGTDSRQVAAVTVRHAPFDATGLLGFKARAEGVPAGVRMTLAWRSDATGEQVHEVEIPVEEGEPRGVLLSGHPHWRGQITGFAVILHGALTSAVMFDEVLFTAGGLGDTFRELYKSWMWFERWSLRSINYLNGGSPTQLLTLPFVLGAASVLVAAVLLFVAPRLHWRPTGAALAFVILAGWLVLDVRWAGNLAQQNLATIQQFGGRSAEARQRAAEDGGVYEFAKRAEATIEPDARVFVVASDAFVRARLAFHLRPHNVWFDPHTDRIPEAKWLKPGDHLVVLARRGIGFDPKERRLRWVDATGVEQLVAAEPLHAEPGGAVFVVR